MLVVTAGSGQYPYHLTIEYCRDRCEEYGYNFKVYELGGLGYGIPVDDVRCIDGISRLFRIALKPELILETLLETEEKTVLWIDGDATLIKPVDELDEDDTWDIGITIRPARKRKKTEYLNAGIFFAKRNDAGIGFMQQWTDAMPDTPKDLTVKPKHYCDQEVLEEKLILPAIDVVPWDAIGTVHKICGARVKFFDCEIYNNYAKTRVQRWAEGPGQAKILHFKGHRMHRLPEYRKEFLNE